VISPTLGMAAVTPFALASRLVEMTKSLLRSATTTLTSAFSSLEAAGDHDRLRATFLAGSRAAWYAGLTAQAGLLLLGPAFLTLWVGHRHAEAGRPVLLALGSVVALSVAQSVASRVLYGLGRLRGFARGTLAEGASNLAISLALVGPFGIAGVAVGTAVPHAAFCVFVLVVVCRLTGVRPTAYVRQIAPAVMAVAPAAMFWAAMARRGIGRWPEWFAVAGVGVAIVAISLAVVEFRLPGRVRSWLATRRRQYAAR
jgi:O-antigen/teichoic acid export membrane protein